MSQSMQLLQMVALTLPAVAILMQAILQIQDSRNETEIQLFTEFQFLEGAFILLILGAGAFIFQIASNTKSLIMLAGLGFVLFGVLLVVPATMFGIRRGAMDRAPERVLLDIIDNRRHPLLATVIAISGGIFTLILFYLLYPQLSQDLVFQYALVVITTVTTLGVTLQLINTYVGQKVSENERQKWKTDVLHISSELIGEIESKESPGKKFINDPKFRGRINRYLTELRRLLQNTPKGIASDDLPEAESFQLSSDAIEELLKERARSTEYLSQVEEELERLEESREELKKELHELNQYLGSIESGERAGDADFIRQKGRVITEEIEEVEEEIEDYRLNREKAKRTRQEVEARAEQYLDEIVDSLHSLTTALESDSE